MLGPVAAQLELQPGDVLTEDKVRASLRRLYETGLYDTIQVEGLRSNGGVVVIFAGRPRLFIGRVAVLWRQQRAAAGATGGLCPAAAGYALHAAEAGCVRGFD